MSTCTVPVPNSTFTCTVPVSVPGTRIDQLPPPAAACCKRVERRTGAAAGADFGALVLKGASFSALPPAAGAAAVGGVAWGVSEYIAGATIASFAPIVAGIALGSMLVSALAQNILPSLLGGDLTAGKAAKGTAQAAGGIVRGAAHTVGAAGRGVKNVFSSSDDSDRRR